jgi:flagellin
MRIQHNIMAMNAYRNYNTNTSALSKNLEKLSSGYKINRAGDDAAGLAISEKMRAQITGLNAAQKNVKDGISLVKTSEGAMQEIQDMLNRMDYLATQSANGTYQDKVDREALQNEVNQLRNEINRIAESANFNGIKLLDGSLEAGGGSVTINGSDRIIQTVLGAGEDPVANTGVKTILDGGGNGSQATKFDVDFTGLATKLAGAAGGGNAGTPSAIGGTASNAAGVDGSAAVKAVYSLDLTAKVQGDVDAKTIDGETVTWNGDLDTTMGDFVTAYNAAGKEYTAAWDTATSKLTLTANDAGAIGGTGPAAAPTAPTVTGATAFTTDTAGVDAVASTKTLDATGLTTTAIKDAADKIAGITNGNITIEKNAANKLELKIGGQVIGTSDEAVNGAVTAFNFKDADGNSLGSVTAAGAYAATDFTKAIDTGLTYTAAQAPAAGGGGGAGGAGGQISFKLGGTELATDAAVATNADAKDIATAIFAGIAGAADANGAKEVTVNGAKWSVTDNGAGKLSFELKDAPTATNIKGNFDWDVSIKTDAFDGNHTAGTTVTQQGQVGAANAVANTVFQINKSDLKDGTTITLDGKTVTLAVGADSKFKDAQGTVIDLTNLDPANLTDADLNTALGKIAQGIGDTTNFIVGVNDKSNGDVNIGLTVHKKAASTQTYDTIDKLASVFSMSTAGTGKPLTLQIGDTSESFNQMDVNVKDMHTTAMGTEGGKSIADINIGTQEGASEAINVIKDAINYVSSVRGDLGAVQNRLEHTQNNLSVMAENIQDAESTIRDTDVAEEMMSYVKNNILVQSAQAMLAQANQVPQGVLQLLG